LKIKRTFAAILESSYQDLILDEIDLPEFLESGQVLVELISSGVCGAQLNEIHAIKGPDLFLPHLLGHEGFCNVLDVAGDVSRVKIGDRAIMHWRKGFGINATPPKYTWKGRPLNAGWITTFNNHAIVSENRLTSISDHYDISPRILHLLGCALTTAYGIATREIVSKPQNTIVVIGTGGVGLALISTLRITEYKSIIAVDKDINKLKIASNLGANETILFTSKDQCKMDLRKVLNGVGADVAIETTGIASCIELAYEETKENGFVNLVGVPNSKIKASIYTLPLHYGKVLKGTDGGSSNPDTDIPIILELICKGVINLDSYPLFEYSLNDINKAIHSVRNRQPGRSIIRF
jgi:Zn-dependent alcohol dehydrogenase